MWPVTEITNIEENDAFIANNPAGVIFFGSSSCPHCTRMVPMYKELYKKYPSVAFAHVEVNKVEVDNIKGVPVFVGYKNHVPVDSVVGESPESLIEMIEQKLL